MVVRRNDSRRRRVGVVADPDLQTSDEVTTASKTKKQTKQTTLYSYGADRRNHSKTTDLVPKRVFAYSLLAFGLVACIGLLNFLSIYAPTWHEQIGVASADSLALTGRGTLASWFSSFLLIMTGLASLQIYALRQHRRDDYRGTYRLWAWMSAIFLFASINCIIDLGAIASNLFQSLTTVSFGDGYGLPFAIKMVVFSTLIARGLFEVRQSRGTFALVVIVWVAYTAAAVLQLPPVQPTLVNRSPELVLGNCSLVGITAIFLAHTTYVRFIFMLAHGLIKMREPKATSTAAKTKSKSTSRTTKKAAASKTSTTRKSKKVASDSDEPEKAATKKKPTPAKATAKPKAKAKASRPPVPKPSTKPSTKPARKPSVKKTKKQDAYEDSVEAELEEMFADEGVIKMSKSERRRQRKADKASKRKRAA